MKKLRSTSLILVIMLLLSVIAACGEPEKIGEGTAAGNGAAVATSAAPQGTTMAAPEGTTTDPNLDENGFILDKLPVNLNYSGKTVNILYWDDDPDQEFFADSEKGEDINDGIYQRNIAVENRLNVKLKFTGIKGNNTNRKSFAETLWLSENGKSDDVYDIIASSNQTAGYCAYTGIVRQLDDLKYLDFDAEWWPTSLREDPLINGKMYFATGDISSNLVSMTLGVFYNADMLEKLKLEDPHSLVKSGEWTLDKMIELGKGVYKDLDGDGKKSDADTFAQQCYYINMDAYLYGSDIVMFKEISDGKYDYTDDFLGTKTDSLVNKIHEYFNSADCRADTNLNFKDNFAAGKILFVTSAIENLESAVSTMTDRIGLLPVPKYSSGQKSYKTVAKSVNYTVYQIPVNPADADMSAAVLECLASESYRNVSPAIFERIMQFRYHTDSSGSSESYDILRKGVVFDLGLLLHSEFSNNQNIPTPSGLLHSAVQSDNNLVSTLYKLNKRGITTIVTEINKNLTK